MTTVPPVTIEPHVADSLKGITEIIDELEGRTARAKEHRDEMIVAALDAGGSLREVAALVGLSGPGVMKIRDRAKGTT